MMTYLHTNFAAVEQAASDIQATMGRLEAGLQDLAASLRPLVDTWDGSAQESFNVRQARWTNAAESIQRILLDWRAKTEAAHLRAVATEQQNKSFFE
jgi:early secretory antigenic target protein ESAT-6